MLGTHTYMFFLHFYFLCPCILSHTYIHAFVHSYLYLSNYSCLTKLKVVNHFFAIAFSRITGSRFQSNYIPFITNANTNSTSDNLLVAGSHPGPVSTVYLCNIMSAVIITSCQTTRALNGLKSMLLPFNLQFPLSYWPNRYLT